MIEIGKDDGYEAPFVLCFVSLFFFSFSFESHAKSVFQTFFHSAELGLKYVDFFLPAILMLITFT